jgi:hypothetical protein
MLVGWITLFSISETSYLHSSSEVKLAISMLKKLLDNMLQSTIGWLLKAERKIYR